MDSSLLALGIRKAGKEESMNIYLAMIKDHRKYALPSLSIPYPRTLDHESDSLAQC
jgi:hypothetical protein